MHNLTQKEILEAARKSAAIERQDLDQALNNKDMIEFLKSIGKLKNL